MESLIFLIIWALLGWWCHSIAERNGRNCGLAFFMGVLFGIVAIIIYAIIGKPKDMPKE